MFFPNRYGRPVVSPSDFSNGLACTRCPFEVASARGTRQPFVGVQRDTGHYVSSQFDKQSIVKRKDRPNKLSSLFPWRLGRIVPLPLPLLRHVLKYTGSMQGHPKKYLGYPGQSRTGSVYKHGWDTKYLGRFAMGGEVKMHCTPLRL